LITTASIPARDSFMRLMRRHQTCRPIHAVKHRWSNPWYFTQKHIWNTGSKSSMSYFSHSGANVPRHFRSPKRMFQGAKVPGSESFRERKYQGAKVPPMVLSLLGTWERKFQLPCISRCAPLCLWLQ